MAIASITVRDQKKLLKKLNRLATRSIRKVNTKAVRESLKPMASAAKRNAPVGETKRLRKGMGRKTKGYKNGNAIGIVGARESRGTGRQIAPHYHLVELGHRIAKGGALRRLKGRRKGQLGTKGVGEGVSVGFVRAQDFVKRAWQANRSKSIGIYIKKLRQGIIEEARKK